MIRIFEKKNWIWVLRIVLTFLGVLTVAWIFSNSLMDGEASSSQSSQVTDIVDGAVDAIAPDLMIGGSEETEFQILHSFVRNMGHFAEFALLCALTTWCVISYTDKRPFLILPILLSVAVAFTDEYIQSFVGGRAQEIKDVFTDFFGACIGFVFAVFAYWIGKLVYRKIAEKRELRTVENFAVTDGDGNGEKKWGE